MFEKDIPIPPAVKYPFAELQVGESVLFKCAAADKSKARKGAYRVAQYRHWKIVVRSLADGVRVWRLV